MTKTRFAPSPTGYLHIGGVRTALFSWLYAKQQGGEFVLRIEDTDRERSTQASVDAILEGMAWLGLEADATPVYQTDRFDRYQQVVDDLMARDLAYYCYATPEELDNMREQQKAAGEKPRYDGRYRDFTGEPPAGIEPVIRFKNPLEGAVTFTDAVRGEITVSNRELDDLIIVRSDGTPTYNFCVTIDDADMGITHVIRGDDHINNTPRQINIAQAIGAKLPVYAHLPMVLGEDGARLSKRHGAVSVLEYQQAGYLPEALLNYLARLGWSHGDQEIFTVPELIEKFSLAGISKAPGSFSTEKLLWVNQQHIQCSSGERLAEAVMPYLADEQMDVEKNVDLITVLALVKERCKTLLDFIPAIRYFYQDFDEFEANAAKKHLRTVAVEPLQTLMAQLSLIEDWQAVSIKAAIQKVVEQLDIGMGKIGMPFRVAITGGGQSPDIATVAALLGKEKVMQRTQTAIDWIQIHRAS